MPDELPPDSERPKKPVLSLTTSGKSPSVGRTYLSASERVQAVALGDLIDKNFGRFENFGQFQSAVAMNALDSFTKKMDRTVKSIDRALNIPSLGLVNSNLIAVQKFVLAEQNLARNLTAAQFPALVGLSEHSDAMKAAVRRMSDPLESIRTQLDRFNASINAQKISVQAIPLLALRAMQTQDITRSAVWRSLEGRRTEEESHRQRERLGESPYLRRERSAKQSKTINHDVNAELLEPDFTIADLKQNWEKFSGRLLDRFPNSLDKRGRKDRYRSMLKYQTEGDYTVVCLLVYRGIDGLIREGLLRTSFGWEEEMRSKKTAKARLAFCIQELANVIKGTHKKIKLLDDGLLDSPIGAGFREALEYLKQAYESFDPICVYDEETKSWRHTFIHEWGEASFVDAFNALLVYDTVLQLVAIHNARR